MTSPKIEGNALKELMNITDDSKEIENVRIPLTAKPEFKQEMEDSVCHVPESPKEEPRKPLASETPDLQLIDSLTEVAEVKFEVLPEDVIDIKYEPLDPLLSESEKGKNPCIPPRKGVHREVGTVNSETLPEDVDIKVKFEVLPEDIIDIKYEPLDPLLSESEKDKNPCIPPRKGVHREVGTVNSETLPEDVDIKVKFEVLPEDIIDIKYEPLDPLLSESEKDKNPCIPPRKGVHREVGTVNSETLPEDVDIKVKFEVLPEDIIDIKYEPLDPLLSESEKDKNPCIPPRKGIHREVGTVHSETLPEDVDIKVKFEVLPEDIIDIKYEPLDPLLSESEKDKNPCIPPRKGVHREVGTVNSETLPEEIDIKVKFEVLPEDIIDIKYEPLDPLHSEPEKDKNPCIPSRKGSLIGVAEVKSEVLPEDIIGIKYEPLDPLNSKPERDKKPCISGSLKGVAELKMEVLPEDIIDIKYEPLDPLYSEPEKNKNPCIPPRKGNQTGVGIKNPVTIPEPGVGIKDEPLEGLKSHSLSCEAFLTKPCSTALGLPSAQISEPVENKNPCASPRNGSLTGAAEVKLEVLPEDIIDIKYEPLDPLNSEPDRDKNACFSASPVPIVVSPDLGQTLETETAELQQVIQIAPALAGQLGSMTVVKPEILPEDVIDVKEEPLEDLGCCLLPSMSLIKPCSVDLGFKVPLNSEPYKDIYLSVSSRKGGNIEEQRTSGQGEARASGSTPEKRSGPRGLKKEKVSCALCSFSCFYKRSLIIHLRSHKNKLPIKCPQCPLRWSNKNHLTFHLRTHTGERPYKCSLCSYAASQKGTLNVHLRIHTGEKPFKCRYCNYSCTVRGSLAKHERIHTGEKPFKCKQCSFTFTRKSTLISHKRTHTGVKPFKCPLCPYASAQTASLNVHKRIHLGEKPFKCDLCPYATSYKSHIVLHLKKHSGVKPFKCKQCSYTCSHNYILTAHMRTHSGIKPFSCPLCPFACFRKTNLTSHVRIHSGEKKFKCPRCVYASNRSTNLVAHMAARHFKPYNCSKCSYSTYMRYKLVKHIRSHRC